METLLEAIKSNKEDIIRWSIVAALTLGITVLGAESGIQVGKDMPGMIQADKNTLERLVSGSCRNRIVDTASHSKDETSIQRVNDLALYTDCEHDSKNNISTALAAETRLIGNRDDPFYQNKEYAGVQEEAYYAVKEGAEAFIESFMILAGLNLLIPNKELREANKYVEEFGYY